MKKSKNKISYRNNSSIRLMLFIAVVLFCCVPFMSSAGNDGQKYRRMQMMQFLKRNIPEYYLTIESDTESVAYDAKSKYGISVEEVHEHYIRQRPQSVQQKTEVYVVKPAENITDDSAGNINTPEFNDAISSRIDTVNPNVVRESFFFNQLQKDNQVNAGVRGTQFLVNKKYNFKVEDSRKLRSVQDSICYAVDNLRIGSENLIPLWLFGFLY